MNKIWMLTAVVLLSACNDSQYARQKACKSVLTIYCHKVAECSSSSEEECLEFIESNALCNKEIKSYVKEISECGKALSANDCTGLPAECTTLE
jgi:hypothetical protein